MESTTADPHPVTGAITEITATQARTTALLELKSRKDSEAQSRTALSADVSATNDAVLECREQNVPWPRICSVLGVSRSAANYRLVEARRRREDGVGSPSAGAETAEDPIAVRLAGVWGGQLRPIVDFQALQLAAKYAATKAAEREERRCAKEVRRPYEVRELVEKVGEGAIAAARASLARCIRERGDIETLEAWTIIGEAASSYEPPWRVNTSTSGAVRHQ